MPYGTARYGDGPYAGATTAEPPIPPVPVVFPLRMGDIFGQGEWSVYVTERGGVPVVHEVASDSFGFSYVIDQAGSYRMSPLLPQRQMLRETEPYRHELNFYRDDWLAMCGPLVQVSPSDLSGYDLFHWLEKRMVDEDLYYSSDMADTWRDLAEWAIAKDPSINLTVHSRPIGIDGVRKYAGKDFPRVADLLRELGRTALDFTTRGRTILTGNLAAMLPTEKLVLHDEGVLSASPIRDAAVFATDVGVFGAELRGSPDPVFGRATRSRSAYGLVQESFAELLLDDSQSCYVNALARLRAFQPVPVRLSVVLSPDAAFTFPELICGRVLDVHLSEEVTEGIAVDGDMLLRQVDVSVSGGQEQVSLDLIPLGLLLSELAGAGLQG